MLKISSSWINACMDISENGLSHSCVGPEAVVYGFNWHRKCIVEVFLHLKLKLNTLGLWSITTDKSLQDWRWANAGAVRRNMKWLRACTDMKFGVGNPLLKFVQVFVMVWYCTCCCYTIEDSIIRVCSHWTKHLFVRYTTLFVYTLVFLISLHFSYPFAPYCFKTYFKNFLFVFYFCSLLCTLS